jgi:linoleoyl-CoA desaturase
MSFSSSSFNPRFSPSACDQFAETVKTRVDEYFESRGLSRHANSLMFTKIVFYLSVFFGLYATILWGGLTPTVTLLLCAALGMCSAFIGFNIGHDAIHKALHSNPRVNQWLGYTFNMIGACSTNWNFTHNIAHHTFTNVPGADGDYNQHVLLRYHSQHAWRWYHRFQHWYAFVLYSVFTLEWIVRRDFVQMFKRQHLIFQKGKPSRWEVFELLTGKLFCAFFYLVIPKVVLDVPWWHIGLGLLVVHVFMGLTLTLVFQLGHLVAGPIEAKVDSFEHLSDEFFTHQLKSSSNFQSLSPVAAWFTGGLNTQIEHHLFPRVCHIHYRSLAPIVKQVALEQGLPYNEYKTYLGAITAHIRFLKRMGARPYTV